MAKQITFRWMAPTSLVLFIFAIGFLSCQPSAQTQQGETPAAKTVSTLQFTPPFCGAETADLDSGVHWAQTLLDRNLMLPCDQIVALAFFSPQSQTTQVVLNKARIAEKYPDVRKTFLEIKKSARALGRKKALVNTQKMLPVALTRAAMAPWLGTQWDFYGASDHPGQGEIACGYFVAATLHAIGFNIRVSQKTPGKRHYYLAGLPSEQIIKSLVSPESIRRFSNRPLVELENAVKAMGPGVYILGLDQHVGYLIYDGTGPVWLWHAKPGQEVTLERPEQAYYVTGSHYRIIGKLDHKTASLWLDDKPI